MVMHVYMQRMCVVIVK